MAPVETSRAQHHHWPVQSSPPQVQLSTTPGLTGLSPKPQAPDGRMQPPLPTQSRLVSALIHLPHLTMVPVLTFPHPMAILLHSSSVSETQALVFGSDSTLTAWKSPALAVIAQAKPFQRTSAAIPTLSRL